MTAPPSCRVVLAAAMVVALGSAPARAQAPARPAPAAPAAAAPVADPVALQAAIDTLGKLDYKTRVEASATVRRAPAAVVVPLLVEAARRHVDGYVRFRALVLLSGFNDPKTTPVFLEALTDENDRLREVAYAYVEEHPSPALVPRLLEALERGDSDVARSVSAVQVERRRRWIERVRTSTTTGRKRTRPATVDAHLSGG